MTLVRLQPDLAFLRRDGRTIVLDPAGGGWRALDGAELREVQALRDPREVGRLSALARSLYERGLLVAGGRAAPPPPVREARPVLVLEGPGEALARDAIARGRREMGPGLILAVVGPDAPGAVLDLADVVVSPSRVDGGGLLALSLETPLDAEVLRGAMGWGRVVVPSVVVREAEHLTEAFLMLADAGFRAFRLIPAPLHDGLADGRCEAFARAVVDTVRLMRAHSGTFQVPELDRMVGDVTRPGSHAEPRQLVVDAAGDVRLAPGGPVVGTVDGGPSWRSLLASPGRRGDAVPRCARCPWRRFCEGGSAARAAMAHGTDRREDPLCRFFQVVYEELLWLLADPSPAA